MNNQDRVREAYGDQWEEVKHCADREYGWIPCPYDTLTKEYLEFDPTILKMPLETDEEQTDYTEVCRWVRPLSLKDL